MKKLLTLMLALVMTLSLTACGEKKENNSVTTPKDETPTTQTSDKNNEVAYGVEDDLIIFMAGLDYKLDDSSAWLGIIPTGTKYEKEVDADDVDMIYCYAVNYEDENKKDYRFEMKKDDLFGIGDGVYDLVLTSSDDAEIGKVLLQIGIEINGNEIVLDFENTK